LKLARHLHFKIAAHSHRNPATDNWKLGHDKPQWVTNRPLTPHGIRMPLVDNTFFAVVERVLVGAGPSWKCDVRFQILLGVAKPIACGQAFWKRTFSSSLPG
jgi:hypothetical protein